MNNTAKINRPELLAPAGNIDAFHAAVDAGADAVYLGVNENFNARLRAKNFTIAELSNIIPYAHSRGVKIYITLNTLVKQSEIKPALNIMYQLDQLNVDAVIIADIGLMKLAATHFQKLRIHGSTQAVIHNSCGLAFMKSLGAKRVVLSRELSLDEIRETTKSSPVETEIFIHGALCYCISGQCLASSFIGGASGNRGRCTQVCRRRFKCSNGIDGYFFSPHDLQAASFIQKLIDIGVSSFKIEGRMKGAEYVSTVVKAYRKIIDNIDDAAVVNQATENLRCDFGREKTAFFLDDRKSDLPIDPTRPAGTGILIGTIIDVNNNSDDDKGASFTVSTKIGNADIAVNTNNNIIVNNGDRIRIQPQNGFEGTACKVVKCETLSDDKIVITTVASSQINHNAGDHVFLIGRADVSSTNSARKIADASLSTSSTTKIKTHYPNADKIASSLTPSTSINTKLPKPILWFKVDNVDWLDILNASPCQRLIFDADISQIEKLLACQNLIKTWRSRMSIALPLFIGESKIKFWRGVVDKCIAAKLTSFTISNAGHFGVIPKNAAGIIADSPLSCLNRFTQNELTTRKLSHFVYSYEDDYLNIRAAANSCGVVTIYGLPPMFISRMRPAINCGIIVIDPHGNKFVVREKNNLYYTLPITPLCLFAKREKLLNCGIENFLIDLAFHAPNDTLATSLVTSYKEEKKIAGSSVFNFKALLH